MRTVTPPSTVDSSPTPPASLTAFSSRQSEPRADRRPDTATQAYRHERTRPAVKVDDEFRSLVPQLTEEERAQLKVNLLRDGCRDPLVVWEGVLLDGHHRLDICRKHRLPFQTVEIKLEDRDAAKEWIIRNQFGRRNLTPYQRAELALELEPLIAAKAREKQREAGGALPQKSAKTPVDTSKEVAKVAGMSHDTIAKAKYVRDYADEETKDRLRKPIGATSIHREYQVLKSKDRRQERIARNATLSTTELGKDEVPRASILLCDPPWQYEHTPTESRAIENQYPTMSLEDIKAEAKGIHKATTPDTVLYMWATSPKLEECFEVLRAWGFKYRTCAVWDKEKIGMGYYFRQQHELLLVATKGELPVPEPDKRPASIFCAGRRKHSQKPDCVYDFMEAAYPESAKRELFARHPRKGWLPPWGYEV